VESAKLNQAFSVVLIVYIGNSLIVDQAHIGSRANLILLFIFGFFLSLHSDYCFSLVFFTVGRDFGAEYRRLLNISLRALLLDSCTLELFDISKKRSYIYDNSVACHLDSQASTQLKWNLTYIATYRHMYEVPHMVK
jgi:hypothetical protein